MSSTGDGGGMFLFPMDLGGGTVTNGNLKVLLRGRIWPSPAPDDVEALRSYYAIKFTMYLVVQPPEERAADEAALLRCYEALKAAIRARGTAGAGDGRPARLALASLARLRWRWRAKAARSPTRSAHATAQVCCCCTMMLGCACVNNIAA
jgi:hypothetical protein